ncbi:uncharacterized protein [Procambarus clarkii]|uniref:uncharacterized protein n=1 Tax=Procambarus clarkii TaxID=6728 RepID=UPI00374410A8
MGGIAILHKIEDDKVARFIDTRDEQVLEECTKAQLQSIADHFGIKLRSSKVGERRLEIMAQLRARDEALGEERLQTPASKGEHLSIGGSSRGSSSSRRSVKLEILKLQLEAQLKREEQEREAQLCREEREAEAQLRKEEVRVKEADIKDLRAADDRADMLEESLRPHRERRHRLLIHSGYGRRYRRTDGWRTGASSPESHLSSGDSGGSKGVVEPVKKSQAESSRVVAETEESTNGARKIHRRRRIRCYNCRVFGHVAWECRHPEKRGNVAFVRVEDQMAERVRDEPVLSGVKRVHPFCDGHGGCGSDRADEETSDTLKIDRLFMEPGEQVDGEGSPDEKKKKKKRILRHRRQEGVEQQVVDNDEENNDEEDDDESNKNKLISSTRREYSSVPIITNCSQCTILGFSSDVEG